MARPAAIDGASSLRKLDMRLAFIVPCSWHAPTLEAGLHALAPFRRHGHRVIAVDGATHDARPNAEALQRVLALVDRLVPAPCGWDRQIDAGCRAPEIETADALVFVPEDVRLPAGADRLIARALSNANSPWGHFDIEGECLRTGASLALRIASALGMAGLRSRLAPVRQVLFVTRGAYLALGGCTGAPDDEESDFSRRARLLGRPVVVRAVAHAP
jgi:hypothetical protein